MSHSAVFFKKLEGMNKIRIYFSLIAGKERRKWRGFRDDERLIMYLMRKTGSKTLADLETKTIQITHFTGAARKLHCHILTALSRWKFRLSTQLFASAPLYKYELCIKLIKWYVFALI